MSKRLFYLADGTLQKATAGEFRGDDPEISTQVVTREIVIKAEDGGTGVKLDPDAPSGPLVLHYDSSKNQKGLTIFDDHSNSIAVEVEHTGVVRANNGISVDAGGISGTAFDTGDWALASSSDAAPYENTVVTRDALAEVVRVSNLRVFDKQNDTTDLNYAGDGLPRGLFFDKGYCGEVLRLNEPTRGTFIAPENAVPGGYLFGQSEDDTHTYRFGFDPEANDTEDGLLFQDKTDTSNVRSLRMTMNDTQPMAVFDDVTNSVQLCTGTRAAVFTGNVDMDGMVDIQGNLNMNGGSVLGVDEMNAETGDFSKKVSIRDELDMHDSKVVNVDELEATAVSVSTHLTCASLSANLTTGSQVSLSEGFTSDTGITDGKKICFQIQDDLLEPVFEIDEHGNIYGNDVVIHGMTIASSDNSNYIGSSRFSYDRTNHVVTLHRLKTDHVPTYLAGRGITTGDVSNINNMTVSEWITFAHDHLDEHDLTIAQVFPHANTGDWIQIDAPVPTLQAWANGADADITTLENEVDAAEVRLDTLEAAGPASAAAMGIVHVDAAYTGGSSDGSLLKPYVSLATAMTAKLTEGATTPYTFKLKPGEYTGAINIQRTTATQSFTIEGSSPGTTFVQSGVDFAAGGGSDVLYLRRFKDVSCKNLTVRFGKYSLPARLCIVYR